MANVAAIRTGKRKITPFPGIDDIDPTDDLARCTKCRTILITPTSIQRGTCRPCLTIVKVFKEALALAKANRGRALQQAAYELYDAPAAEEIFRQPPPLDTID